MPGEPQAWLLWVYRQYHAPEFIRPDPLEWVRRFPQVRDREVVALVAACLAYGRVSHILASLGKVLPGMGVGKFRGEPEGPQWHIDTKDVLASAVHAAQAARQAGLEIFSFASRCAADDLDLFESLCRAASSISCPQVRIGVAGYDATLGFWGSIARARGQISKAIERARKYKVRTVLELHDNTMADGVLACHHLVQGMDPREVGVIFDAGNARVYGYQPWPEALDILCDFIAHVHVKDLNWVRKGDQRAVEFAGPDEGVVPK